MNSQKAKRQEQLDALRRRRADRKTKPEPELDEQASSYRPSTGSESEASQNQQQNESVDEENSVEYTAALDDEDLDQYEDDFVLQDDESDLGVPTDIPFEFTRHAYKQAKEYLGDAVEWMVHNKLNPAFPRSDPHYRIAFAKLDDEVKGRTGSQFVSTVWSPAFQRAIMARPHIQVTPYPVSENQKCDACNRSSHPASFEIKLYGKPYALDTLEPLSDEDSSGEDDDDGDEDVERDRDGNVLLHEGTRFLLGRSAFILSFSHEVE